MTIVLTFFLDLRFQVMYDRFSAIKQKQNGKRILSLVISLEETYGSHEANQGRLAAFDKAWSKHCKKEEMDFKLCPGHLSSVRGVGVSLAIIQCLTSAYNDGYDYIYLFEDDGVPFDSTVCEDRQVIAEGMPADALVLLLGGHDLWIKQENLESNLILMEGVNLVVSEMSFGFYGFVVARDKVVTLTEELKSDVERCTKVKGKVCSPDVLIYSLAKKENKTVYITNPLLIDHLKGSFSNTWNKPRDETRAGAKWAGVREVVEGSILVTKVVNR